MKNLSGCCCCGQTELDNQCPEWSENDIISSVVPDLQLAGAVAFIGMVYLIGALIVASIVRGNLKNYKTDYI